MPLPGLAWNQLPLLADSPQMLPAGQIQFEVGLQFRSHENFAFSAFSEGFARNLLSIPTLGVKVGLGPLAEVELTYEVLCVEERDLLIKEQWKSGDLAFFTKVHILDEGRRRPGLGIKFGAKLPNASESYRVGTNETDLAIVGLFEKTFAAFRLTANLGFLNLGDPYHNAAQDDLLSYSLACTLPGRQDLTYTIEVAGQAGGVSHNERASAVFHLYFQQAALTWNLAARAGLLGNSEAWGLAGGVRWTFDF